MQDGSTTLERAKPGARFGKLVVAGDPERRRTGKRTELFIPCVCDCGKASSARIYSLLDGRTKSCGCMSPKGRNQGERLRPGARFGRLVVTGECEFRTAERWKGRRRFAPCRCDCGAEVWVMGCSLLSGNTRSCGCRFGRKPGPSGRLGQKAFKHGASRTKLYEVWCGMRARCYSPGHASYQNYGGRGIAVCDGWREDFAAFRDWALASGYQAGLTLERNDNDGPYAPENCRWATHSEQARNTRRTQLVTAFGETKSLIEWGEDPRCRIKRGGILHRIGAGWSPEDAISLPPYARPPTRKPIGS